MANDATDANAIPEALVYDFDPRNIPDDALRAVGLVATAASQTESIVQQMIGALLSLDNIETRALTAHMASPLRDQIIRAVAELNAPLVSEIDEIDDLLDDIRSAFQLRNAIIHNAIVRHPSTGELFSFREQARGVYSAGLQPISIKEIEEHATIIYDAGIALMQFIADRGISPRLRTRSLHVAVNRSKKARSKRRDL